MGRIEIMRDLIIIGAGPSGSMAAREAAKRGLDVLMVDRSDEIGVPKRCAEGIGKTALQEHDIPLVDKFIAKRIHGASIYSPNNTELTVDYNDVSGFILERKVFDKYLARLAASEGAEVLASVESTSLISDSEGNAKGVNLRSRNEEWTEEARIIIGADGVDSLVARWADMDSSVPPKDLDAGYQYEMADVDFFDSDRIHLYFNEEFAPRGYVWIFPKGEDTANIGVGIGGDDLKTAKYYLDKFIEEKGIKGSIIERNVGGIPVGGPLDSFVVNNVAVVGDAARQVNPIHGGGIDEALKSGEIAGKKAAIAINQDDISILEEYEKEWREKRGEKLKRILKVRKAAENMGNEDINAIFKVVKENSYDKEDLLGISQGDYKPLFRSLVKNPKLVMRKNIIKTLKEAL